METYPSAFQFRKWPKSQRRRCNYCRRIFAAGPSAKYCRTCSNALLGQVQFISDGRPEREPKPLTAPPQPTSGHFAEIDYMARDQHGRAVLTAWQLRQHESCNSERT
jgi:hypothetical protein